MPSPFKTAAIYSSATCNSLEFRGLCADDLEVGVGIYSGHRLAGAISIRDVRDLSTRGAAERWTHGPLALPCPSRPHLEGNESLKRDEKL